MGTPYFEIVIFATVLEIGTELINYKYLFCVLITNSLDHSKHVINCHLNKKGLIPNILTLMNKKDENALLSRNFNHSLPLIKSESIYGTLCKCPLSVPFNLQKMFYKSCKGRGSCWGWPHLSEIGAIFYSSFLRNLKLCMCDFFRLLR